MAENASTEGVRTSRGNPLDLQVLVDVGAARGAGVSWEAAILAALVVDRSLRFGWDVGTPVAASEVKQALGFKRRTIERARSQLTEEGWLRTRPGAGNVTVYSVDWEALPPFLMHRRVQPGSSTVAVLPTRELCPEAFEGREAL